MNLPSRPEEAGWPRFESHPAAYQLCGHRQVTSFDRASVSPSEKWAEVLSFRVLMEIQRDYACNLLSTLPDIQFKLLFYYHYYTASSSALPRNMPSPLPTRTYSRPLPPGSLPGLPLPVGTAPVVQTAQAHELNYMLPWQNACLPVLGCYLTSCLYFKM